ncbi:DNA primase [Streptomyces sp. NPDC052043]|uniref:DNA primase n=1 Tax=Streptomyces sp. NPDC052043 TaxID=3365684 RepID=UPI0037D481D5
MNKVGLGLAIGAGYLLGRTKKAKLALTLGSLVAGKKLNLGPAGIAQLVDQQLANNPQLKEIGDQLREDLKGVGKAASGAVAERQMNALADRLHGRTAQIRDELAGVGPQPATDEEAEGEDAHPDEREDEREREDEYEDDYEDREGREAEEGQGEAAGDRRGPARKEAARKAPTRKAPGRKAPARKAPAKKAPGKKAAAEKAAARGTAAKKTAAAGDTHRAARSRRPKGGGDR